MPQEGRVEIPQGASIGYAAPESGAKNIRTAADIPGAAGIGGTGVEAIDKSGPMPLGEKLAVGLLSTPLFLGLSPAAIPAAAAVGGLEGLASEGTLEGAATGAAESAAFAGIPWAGKGISAGIHALSPRLAALAAANPITARIVGIGAGYLGGKAVGHPFMGAFLGDRAAGQMAKSVAPAIANTVEKIFPKATSTSAGAVRPSPFAELSVPEAPRSAPPAASSSSTGLAVSSSPAASSPDVTTAVHRGRTGAAYILSGREGAGDMASAKEPLLWEYAVNPKYEGTALREGARQELQRRTLTLARAGTGFKELGSEESAITEPKPGTAGAAAAPPKTPEELIQQAQLREATAGAFNKMTEAAPGLAQKQDMLSRGVSNPEARAALETELAGNPTPFGRLASRGGAPVPKNVLLQALQELLQSKSVTPGNQPRSIRFKL